MPPDRGRASQACTACRKQKTRCYPSPHGGGACLRCERIQQACSLDVPLSPGNGQIGRSALASSAQDNDRLSRLETIVQSVVERLDALAPRPDGSPIVLLSSQNGQTNLQSQHLTNLPENGAATNDSSGDTPASVTSVAPVFVLRDVAKEVGVNQQNQDLSNGVGIDLTLDIIDSGVLSLDATTSLLAIFLENYARWVAFDDATTAEQLLGQLKNSPLLLCACCLIAVRHTTQEYALALAPRLFQEAKALFSAALLQIPQSIEFYQSTIILSLWSTTIGQALLSIDSWLISGFALQHAVSSDVFSHMTAKQTSTSLSEQEMKRWFIWNHLCLTHLHYCVGTRRKALLSREQIQNCAHILDCAAVNNFETRMVAEVKLYWIIYESCSSPTVDLPETQNRLRKWQEDWTFLFDQPRPQFVQMGFHFAHLLMYDQALKSRSATVRQSLVLDMVRLSSAIINLAMDTSDLRTPHLSDHIYHTISFAAVTLCRLLHMYEGLISTFHEIHELDQLVLRLVVWLRSIGLPCHVAHSLGDVVSAFHAKLRPHAKPTPTYEESWIQTDLLNYPDQFGNELFYFSNGHFSPDWDPYVQGPGS